MNPIGLLLAAAVLGFSPALSSAAVQQGEMAGYLLVPNGRVPAIFTAGFSMYVAGWPLLHEYPGNRFQTGLFGTWMGWTSTSVQMDGTLPASKGDIVRTPNLEPIAPGMGFVNAYAPSPWCTPKGQRRCRNEIKLFSVTSVTEKHCSSTSIQVN